MQATVYRTSEQKDFSLIFQWKAFNQLKIKYYWTLDGLSVCLSAPPFFPDLESKKSNNAKWKLKFLTKCVFFLVSDKFKNTFKKPEAKRVKKGNNCAVLTAEILLTQRRKF